MCMIVATALTLSLGLLLKYFNEVQKNLKINI